MQFRLQKSGHDNEVVVWEGSTVNTLHFYADI